MIVAFATGNLIAGGAGPVMQIQALIEGASADGNSPFNDLFTGAIEATEEAVYNALVAAETMTGVDGHVMQAIPHDRLRELLRG